MNNHRSELQNFWWQFALVVVAIGFVTIPLGYYNAPIVHQFVSSIPDTVRVYLVQRWGF
jgi:hypothetical protein